MHIKVKLRLDKGRRAQGFLTKLIQTLTNVPEAIANLKTRLDRLLVQADELAEQQQSDAKAISTHRRGRLRNVLQMRQLRALARVSKLIENANPGFIHIVSVPTKYIKEDDLLTLARAAVSNATRHRALFEQYGMPAGLLNSINNSVADIVAERAVGKELLNQRIKATAGLDVVSLRIALTVDAITPTLNTLIDTLGESAALEHAAWKRASRGYQLPEGEESAGGDTEDDAADDATDEVKDEKSESQEQQTHEEVA